MLLALHFEPSRGQFHSTVGQRCNIISKIKVWQFASFRPIDALVPGCFLQDPVNYHSKENRGENAALADLLFFSISIAFLTSSSVESSVLIGRVDAGSSGSAGITWNRIWLVNYLAEVFCPPCQLLLSTWNKCSIFGLNRTRSWGAGAGDSLRNAVYWPHVIAGSCLLCFLCWIVQPLQFVSLGTALDFSVFINVGLVQGCVVWRSVVSHLVQMTGPLYFNLSRIKTGPWRTIQGISLDTLCWRSDVTLWGSRTNERCTLRARVHLPSNYYWRYCAWMQGQSWISGKIKWRPRPVYLA